MTEPAITYTWGIANLEVVPSEDGLSNVVKNIHWTLSATDGQFTASGYGSAGTGAVDPDAFTPYEELTQADVIGWLEQLLEVDQLRTSLANQIADQQNPPIITPPLPWA